MSASTDRFQITAVGSGARTFYQIWEYDLTKPRRPTADDPRARYKVKRYVNGYRTMKAATRAIERLLAGQETVGDGLGTP